MDSNLGTPVLAALATFPITTFEAMRFLDVYHCPARVLQLRKDGHQIVTHRKTVINEAGAKHSVGLYVLQRGAGHVAGTPSATRSKPRCASFAPGHRARPCRAVAGRSVGRAALPAAAGECIATAAKKRHKGNKIDESFVWLPYSVMNSPLFIALSPHAVKLMIDIAAQYRGDNNGDLSLAWKLMKPRGWRSQATLHKAKRWPSGW